MVRLPKYVSPFTVDYKTYVDSLKDFNIQLQISMQTSMSESLGWLGNYRNLCAVVTTGSDGRFEKGPASKLEFLIFTDTELLSRYLIHDVIKEIGLINRIVDNNIDMRNIRSDSMSFYQNDHNRTFPARVVDASFIYGDRDLLHDAYIALVAEFKSDKSVLDRVSEKKREHKLIVHSGIQSYKGMQRTHFDLVNGIAYYDPKECLLSFKIGPLRYIQTALMQDFIAHSRASPIEDAAKLFITMPTNTDWRLRFLDDKNLLKLSFMQIEDLIDCYSYFLWSYNKSQDNYVFKGVSETPFDLKEVQERLLTIQKIVDGPIMKRKK